MRKRRLRVAAVPLALALAVAACSTSDDDDAADATDAAAAAATAAATEAASAATEAADAASAAATTVAEATAAAAGSDTTAASDETTGDTEGTQGTTAGGETTAGGDTTTAGTGAGEETTIPDATFEVAPVAVEDIDLTVDQDLAGTTVTVYGVEDSETEGGAVSDALNAFAEANDMTVEYIGNRDFEEQIRVQVAADNPPDIANFPQPGTVADLAESGDILAVPDDVVAAVSENWSEDWLTFSNIDGTQYGVPVKSDVKSLVWYLPASFEEKGYEVPETYTDFIALTEEMIANGDTPLCVGVQSGPATGWPFTDWVEELVLRQYGTDVYDQWVAHEIPANSPEIVDVMGQVADLWNTEGMVYASGGSIVSTPFGDNAQPLVDGDCMMHRQASFFSSFMPEGQEYGTEEGQVDVFYFPSDEGRPILTGGISSAAFRDAPEVWAVLQYMASPEYASVRQAAQTERAGGGLSGFLTAVDGVDTTLFQPLEQNFLEILATGEPARFDASDLMPGEVQTAFFSAAVDLISGTIDAEEAGQQIEDAWP